MVKWSSWYPMPVIPQKDQDSRAVARKIKEPCDIILLHFYGLIFIEIGSEIEEEGLEMNDIKPLSDIKMGLKRG
jgi:hypothetical protein